MGAFPDWLEPMAATLTQKRFCDPAWVFERKFDGIRLLAFKNGPNVRLLSRNRLPQNFPLVAQAVGGLHVDDVILDGEAVWSRRGIAYQVFDILWLNGADVTSLPLEERRPLLTGMSLTPPLELVRWLTDAVPWERARSEGWEGVIAKRRDSPYEHRRSPHWLKMKCEHSQDFVVGGFTDPQGGRVGLAETNTALPAH
jgi:ATP-dependent DNA ligase